MNEASKLERNRNGQVITFFFLPKGLKERITEARTTLFFAALTKQTSLFIWLQESTEAENDNIIAIVHISL